MATPRFWGIINNNSIGSSRDSGGGGGAWGMTSKWLPRVSRNPLVRRAGMLLMLFMLVYLFTVLNLSLVNGTGGPRPSNVVKAEIVQLSEEYIRALAKENGDIVDGPYAGRFTAFDLKKTIAVLLESMLSRITRLEIMVNNVTNGSFLNDHSNSTTTNNHHNNLMMGGGGGGGGGAAGKGSAPMVLPVSAFQQRASGGTNGNSAGAAGGKDTILSAADLLQGKSEKCKLSNEDLKSHPHCMGKIEWMRTMWKSDACYKKLGVDGTDCSIIMYLSEVEGYCPRQAWSGGPHNATLKAKSTTYANMTLDLQGLMELLKDPNERQGYAWIRMRITRMWDQWRKAALHMAASQNMNHRPKQKILVHLGLLSKQTGWKFAENQFKGGPLGELVQWSDLISSLYILGHELKITSETEQLVEILNHVPAASTPCQSRKELPVELVYTDIVGLIQLKKKLKAGYAKFGCMFRIVDSFGTEPAFNHRKFARQNKILSSWGGQDLNPLQFNTMFPHSPDNTFLGFVVERLLLNDTEKVNNNTKKDIALVYGKNDYMWQDKSKYLDIIHKYLEIHGTVYKDPKAALKFVPSYTTNHGILSGPDLHKLLQQTKIFVGLGFPYEGPAALEAIANGAVFLNPRFNPAHTSKNNKFFKGKPTQREVTSQHPYAETFIGPPYVYTVDIKNSEEVEKAVKEILANQQFKPFLPFEYTEGGMLQRVNAFLGNQNFCEGNKKPGRWPPRSAVQFVTAAQGKSCKDSCWDQKLICEPSYFPDLNTQEALQNVTTCKSSAKASNIYYPALDAKTQACTTQLEPLLFSCVGSSPSLQRLCPCRNFMPGQTALCQGCER